MWFQANYKLKTHTKTKLYFHRELVKISKIVLPLNGFFNSHPPFLRNIILFFSRDRIKRGYRQIMQWRGDTYLQQWLVQYKSYWKSLTAVKGRWRGDTYLQQWLVQYKSYWKSLTAVKGRWRGDTYLQQWLVQYMSYWKSLTAVKGRSCRLLLDTTRTQLSDILCYQLNVHLWKEMICKLNM